ncbi:MAG: MATE family efflux transporter [Lachnospiraceae bacterium]|nr:MATE family efflux transporter [Lachnospiraceae bacterium]
MSNNTAEKHDFTKGSTAAGIVRLSLPMILAQLVNVLYNIVDRMYLGHMPGDGRLALTGVGVAFPIITIINAFANLCGSGGAPLCSIERGRGDEKTAEQIMGNSLTLLVFFGVLLTAAGYFLKTPLLYLFGASDETIPYANAYMDIYLAGNLFVMLGLGMNPFIESQGFAKTGMLTVVIGAFLNLILDPIFIFRLNMGVQGAAAATILSQLVSALWVLIFLSGKKAILRLRLSTLRLKADLVKQILALGLSGFTMSVTNSLVQIFCNASLQFYGGDLYVGAMTIIYSVREVVQMPMQGFTQGAQPVLGYNYGAGESGRVKEGIRFIRRVTLIYAAVVWGVLMLFPQTVVRLFNGEAELLEVAVVSMRWHFALFIFMAFQYVGQTVFVSLGKAKQAVFFSLFRKAILGVPLILLLPHLWGLGIYGVLAAEPVTNIVGGLACYFTMIAVVWKNL